MHIEDFDYIVPMADVVQDDLKESFKLRRKTAALMGNR